MSLINLKTDLKSLKYGRDTIDGGDSKLPLVKTPIPENFAEIGNTGGFDSTLRGGSLIGTALTNDIIRIGKLINTSRTFQGAAFKSKMNLLSRTNVKTQVDTQKYNQGEYQTRNTIAQISADPFGTRFELFSGNLRYFDTVKRDQSLSQNRLVQFYDLKIDQKVEGNELYSYDGGPGSTAGLGTTIIKLAGDRTGKNNNSLSSQFTNPAKDNSLFDLVPAGAFGEPETYFNYKSISRTANPLNPAVFAAGVSPYLLNSTIGTRYYTLGQTLYNIEAETGDIGPSFGQGYKGTQAGIYELRQDPDNLFTQDDIQSIQASTIGADSLYQPDFRETIKNKPENSKLKLAYSKYTLFNRASYGGPTSEAGDDLLQPNNLYQGTPGLISTLVDRSVDPATITKPSDHGTDWVNYSKIQSQPDPQLKDNDYIPFYVSILKYNGGRDTIQFRAFVEGFSDSYKADWSSFKYLGRGENFYNYNGFDRSINLSFTVHAQSKAELLRQYQKLNRLAASLAPDYSYAGIMRGNFMELTFGDYIVKQPGVLTGLNFNIPDNSPYEIGRYNQGDKAGELTNEGDRLPHMIKVEGFTFQPIHNFIPQKTSKFISLGNRNQGYGEEEISAADDYSGGGQGEFAQDVKSAADADATSRNNELNNLESSVVLNDKFGTNSWGDDGSNWPD